MIEEVVHIGITVSNIENSIDFYQNVLKMKLTGSLVMEGKETDFLFNKKNCKVKVAYLNGSDQFFAPPIELIEFVGENIEKTPMSLERTGVSEICFKTDNIEEVYTNLLKNNVKCLSSPQSFDFSSYGFGKSKALYFLDPDGTILELMENL